MRASTTQPPAPPEPRGGTRTILIVDDEPKIRQLLAAHLGRHGFRTLAASDGAEALALIRRTPPDAVVLDVVMPRMDGFECLRHLKASPASARIPVVMLTRKGDPAHVERGVTSGVDFYLPKPFTLENLLDFLRLAMAEEDLEDGRSG